MHCLQETNQKYNDIWVGKLKVKGENMYHTNTILKKKVNLEWPGWGAQLRLSSQYIEAVGSIPSQGTYKMQPMNA